MPGVFISYRREDSSAWTGRLFDILSARFGRNSIFMDLDGIEGGDDFVTVIEGKLQVSDVLLAIIGNHWLTATDANGARRLDNPGDFVRLEIGKALERNIRVVPVLFGGATMPRPEDLPKELRELSERQAVDIRDNHFHQDADQLLAVLHRPNKRRLFTALAAIAALIVLVCGMLVFRHSAKTANVSGDWNAKVKYDWGDSYPEKFHFEVDGAELSGSASFLRVDRGILDGKITGDRISFTTKTLVSINSEEKMHEDKHYYKGVLANNAIQFTMNTDSEVESHVPIHFTATRTAPH
jgi:hypothetical protein